MPRRSAYRICLPNFCGARRRPRWGCRGARSAVGDARRWPARDSSSTRATSTALGHRRGCRPSTPSASSGTRVRRDAEGDADAGVRRPAVAGERVVAAAAADRLQPLVAGHEDLDDGAGVVVEAAGDPQVGLDGDVVARPAVAQPSTTAASSARPVVEQLVLDAEGADALDEGGVGDADRRQLQAALRPAPAWRPAVSTSSARDGVGRLLVELVDGPDRGGDVGDARGRGRSPGSACGC